VTVDDYVFVGGEPRRIEPTANQDRRGVLPFGNQLFPIEANGSVNAPRPRTTDLFPRTKKLGFAADIQQHGMSGVEVQKIVCRRQDRQVGRHDELRLRRRMGSKQSSLTTPSLRSGDDSSACGLPRREAPIEHTASGQSGILVEPEPPGGDHARFVFVEDHRLATRQAKGGKHAAHIGVQVTDPWRIRGGKVIIHIDQMGARDV